MANHEYNQWEWKGEKYECNPGQFITSLQNIAKTAGKGISTQNVRTALVRFEKLQFLTNESTRQGRLITILKWEPYQVKKYYANKAINKHLTNDQQTPNKHLTTNNNENNVKMKINKYKYAEFVKLTKKEYQKLVSDYGEAFTQKCIDKLDNYKGAKGKRYKSDYRAIKSWVIDEVAKNFQPELKPSSALKERDEWEKEFRK